MNPDDSKQMKFGLTKDMLAVPDLIRSFDSDRMRETAKQISDTGRLLITGEGSSRLFPAKNAIASAKRLGSDLVIHTEAGLQSMEYVLDDWAVFALSNSGRTAEVMQVFHQLKDAGHRQRYSLAAFADSPLESLASTGYVLQCGAENAVAATKSVIEQALFLHALVGLAGGDNSLESVRDKLADQVQAALTTPIDASIVKRVAAAKTIYWAGRNDGVAEELTLKTNEIVRKPSDFLEGTYAVHGIEEVMQADDVLIWVDPYPGSEEKFQTVLKEGVGMEIIAIASRPTLFPTITIPDGSDLAGFVQMAAGWNLLVEVGIKLGVNIDKPIRARKVGNEFVAQTT